MILLLQELKFIKHLFSFSLLVPRNYRPVYYSIYFRTFTSPFLILSPLLIFPFAYANSLYLVVFFVSG